MEKLLNEIIDNCNLDIKITGIMTNSKEIKEGDLFLCTSGKTDRHDFIPNAIKQGAKAVICQHEIEYDIPHVIMTDLDDRIDEIYSRFYDYPQDKLKIIGITGTDGKTSTTTIIQSLIGNDLCGYIGTNGYNCKTINGDLDNTTPGKETLYRVFNEFVEVGCKYVAIEASSEGFYYKRLDNIKFYGAGLTNIDSEHMNTHKTIENYIDCKKQLFRQTISPCVLNSNSKYFEKCLDACKEYVTYGYNPSDTLYIKDVQCFPNKSIYHYVIDNKEYVINTKLLGSFNAENLACALLVLKEIGFNFEELIKHTNEFSIPGRMDVIDEGQDFHVIVDYAHTPNGLTRLFEFVKTLDVNNVITVSGQAGERDASKRKYVGKIIAENSDKVFFTYEDPRHEDINHIIDDMTELIKNKTNYERVLDRHDAIEKAIFYAKANDLVLILGKGQEDGNYIGDEWIYFVDNEEAKKSIHKKEKEKLSNK